MRKCVDNRIDAGSNLQFWSDAGCNLLCHELVAGPGQENCALLLAAEPGMLNNLERVGENMTRIDQGIDEARKGMPFAIDPYRLISYRAVA